VTPTFSPQVDQLTPFRYEPSITDFEVWKIFPFSPVFAILMLCWRASFEIRSWMSTLRISWFRRL
jgi:hypothetical protein